MLALTALETSSLLLQQMVLLEFIMSLLELVFHYFKVTKMKSQRSLSTLRVTKLSQLVAIKPAVSGQWIQATRFRFSRATRMKYSHAHSITKEIL